MKGIRKRLSSKPLRESISAASYDDMFTGNLPREFEEIAAEFVSDDGNSAASDIDDLCEGLSGSDIASMTSHSDASSFGRGRSVSDSSYQSFSGLLHDDVVDDEDDGDTFTASVSLSDDTASTTSRSTNYSRATFEQVFSKSKKKGKKKKDTFEMENPMQDWNNKATAKQAMYQVLAKPGQTPVEKARKLFLLEQLQQPSPPAEPPSFWSNPSTTIGLPIRKRRALSQRKLLPTYKVNDTKTIQKSLEEQGTKLWYTFTTLEDVPSQSSKRTKALHKLEAKRSKLSLSDAWSVKQVAKLASKHPFSHIVSIRIAKAVAVMLRNLNALGYYTCGVSIGRALVNKSLVVHLLDDGSAVNLSRSIHSTNEYKDLQSKMRQHSVTEDDIAKFDVLTFGILLFELIVAFKRGTTTSEAPETLVKLATEERAVVINPIIVENTSSPDVSSLAKLEALSPTIEQEIRDTLSSLECPATVVELCVQCCDPSRGNRPDPLDIVEWLEGALEDHEKNHTLVDDSEDDKKKKKKKTKKSEPQGEIVDTADTMLEVILNAKKLTVECNPKTLRVADTIANIKNLELTMEETDDEGYETDDSFQPPKNRLREVINQSSATPAASAEEPPPLAPTELEQENKRASKLLQFLKPADEGAGTATTTTKDTAAGSSPSPSKAQKKTKPPLPKRKSKAAPAGDFADAANTLLNNESLIRRRSLDRGYLYAKQRLSTSNPNHVATKHVHRFKEAWVGKQTRLNSAKVSDPEDLARQLEKQQLISKEDALSLVKKATQIMKKEPNLLNLKAPMNVVGDIHGQFFDLRNMMQIGGVPQPGGGKKKKSKKQNSYLFLGDYVDRGEFSCEVILYLFALKVKYKENMWLLRGNHECRSVASYFGFKEECEMKYGTQVFNSCMEAFQSMPVAAVVESRAGRFLCLHGGISPNVTSLDQFVEFDRFEEPGMNGFLCDVLWSDPVKDDHEDGQNQSLGEFLDIDYLPNPARGCSYRYGFRALVTFLAENKLVAIIRAHEVQEEGYRYHFQQLTGAKGSTNAQVTPPVITVFSAPDYCGRYGNKAAYIRLHEKPPGKKSKGTGSRPMDYVEPIQFIAVPHPPAFNFENAAEQEVVRIEATCPYMPSTFYSFIKKAIELVEDEPLLGDNVPRSPPPLPPSATKPSLVEERKSVDQDDIPPPPPDEDFPPPPPPEDADKKRKSNRKSKKKDKSAKKDKKVAEQTTKKETAVADQDTKKPKDARNKEAEKKKKRNKAAALLGLDDSVDEAAMRATKTKTKQHQEYENAASVDGINEMNPQLIQSKIKVAKEKMVKNGAVVLPGMDASAEKMLERADSDFSLSALGAKPAHQEDDDLTFTSKELVALQLLFLLIDHKEDGKIDADDLVAWSEEDGTAVPRNEAEMCIMAVDADGDGQLGFEDYLAFAARCKEKWLFSQYNNVVEHIKQMRLESPVLNDAA